ncbi:nuclear transport factor 2 family protein [Saccharibacillus sacchari]|uniref:Nuclear transport factor 2 family protein n=1 Tax=Saccharibacillus sacchari TaxID=456493 RepID=A0ACC6PHI3_9BACL
MENKLEKLERNSAEELAQRQLDCYNAHDLEGFLAVYAEDAKLYNLLDGTLMAEGREAMRERYRKRFEEDNVHAKLVNRMVIGSRVIDHEEVTSNASDRALQAAAIYETQGGLIRAAWFVNE